LRFTRRNPMGSNLVDIISFEFSDRKNKLRRKQQKYKNRKYKKRKRYQRKNYKLKGTEARDSRYKNQKSLRRMYRND